MSSGSWLCYHQVSVLQSMSAAEVKAGMRRPQGRRPEQQFITAACKVAKLQSQPAATGTITRVSSTCQLSMPFLFPFAGAL